MANQYRIRFYESAETCVDPFELAWLIAKHDLDIVAKSDTRKPIIWVRCTKKHLKSFADEINRQFGPLIFDAIEEPDPDAPDGYSEVQFD